MARIFVTRPLPGDALQQLEAEHEVTVYPHDQPMPRSELLAAVAEIEVLICLLTDEIDQELMNAAPRLRIVANYAVGHNNINIDWATFKDIAVLNTPGVLTDASADLAFALLLAAARRVPESDRFVREGKWTGWSPTMLLGTEVTGKTLGLVGMGRIGQAMARRARGFEMPILYSNREPVQESIERELGATYVELDELLERSDFVSLHCPLTPKTKHLLNAKKLAKMKPGSILINTARGPIVDERALAQALKEGPLAAAGLDVFEDEPQVHPDLLAQDNVVLTPHTGSASREAREAMVELLVRGIQQIFSGGHPHNLLNPEVLGTSTKDDRKGGKNRRGKRK